MLHDYDVWLEKPAPHEPTSQYRHNRTGEGNADAHMKRQLMGREVVVAITKGKLDLGPGNKSSTANSMGDGANACSSKLLGSDYSVSLAEISGGDDIHETGLFSRVSFGKFPEAAEFQTNQC